MILQIDDWKFDIDMTASMEYSSSELEAHCDCAYCRNFYAAIDSCYPNLRPLLAQFGVEIEAPDELMPFDFPEGMSYDAVYAVAGRILMTGKELIPIDGIFMKPEADSQVNHSALFPHFFLTINDLRLPWVLDEPMQDVVSPANFPTFLKKMWNKFLNRQPTQEIQS